VEVLAGLLLVTYYVVTGLYVIAATCVASSCLVAVGTLLIRQVARDTIDYVTYGS
jgi:hypothetical protein